MDFGSLVGHLGRLGVASGVHFGYLGLPVEILGGHSGVILGVLGCRGAPFRGSGGAPEGLRRVVVAKVRLPLSRPALFCRFWPPKGDQKASKNGTTIGKK